MNKFLKTLIVSAGNTLMRDDGLGFAALQRLQQVIVNENIQFFDSGTDIFKLMTIQEEYEKIIILDAIQSGNEPGTIYRFHLDQIDSINKNNSLHQIKLTEALKLLKVIQNNFAKSEIILYGIEPFDISFGEEISPVIQNSIKYMVDLICAELENARSYSCQKYN
ncbi:MAG: Hydrogenase maturation protease [Ignavibacteriae bacterium]|nr:MAG: Hydrogenase maturation protease [Ignavibacteriota bacterium]